MCRYSYSKPITCRWRKKESVLYLPKLKLCTHQTLTCHSPAPPHLWQPWFCLHEFDQVPYRGGILQYVPFSVWLISPSLMSSCFVHIVACVRISCYYYFTLVLSFTLLLSKILEFTFKTYWSKIYITYN